MNTGRLSPLRKTLSEASLDGGLISSPDNISYLTQTISRDSWLLVTGKGAFYITDSRYTEEAKRALAASFEVVKIQHSFTRTLCRLASRLKVKSLGFEPKHITFQGYTAVKEALEKCGVSRFHPLPDTVEGQRQVKSAQELALIRQAVKITADTYEFCRAFLEPGLTELEVAAEIERFIRQQGASAASFETIVGAGPSASFPHHLTSARKLHKDDPVLIDMGVAFQGYKSDLTRIFFLGKISPLARKIYDIVLKAQEQAIKRVKPGVKASEIDAAARTVIARAGYGRYFGHSTGHGVGLEVHEAPAISEKNAGILQPGMVFTVEPGIYLPNKAGVRIEDMVLVTGKGVEVLSGFVDK